MERNLNSLISLDVHFLGLFLLTKFHFCFYLRDFMIIYLKPQ